MGKQKTSNKKGRKQRKPITLKLWVKFFAVISALGILIGIAANVKSLVPSFLSEPTGKNHSDSFLFRGPSSGQGQSVSPDHNFHLNNSLQKQSDADQIRFIGHISRATCCTENSQYREALEELEMAQLIDLKNIIALRSLRFAYVRLYNVLIRETEPSNHADTIGNYPLIRKVFFKVQTIEREIDKLNRDNTNHRRFDLYNSLPDLNNKDYLGFSELRLAGNVETKEPSSRLLAIGIDSYPDDLCWVPLAFAVSDAEKVSEAFSLHDFKTTQLINEEGNKSNILNSLLYESLISKPGDTFVLYIAGHGFVDINGNKFVVTYNESERKKEVLSISEIKAFLSIHRGTTYVLIDTCFNELDIDLGTNPATNAKLVGDNHPAILVAGQIGERAIESYRFEAGLTTFALLEFLNDSLDSNGIGSLDFEDMFSHITKTTSSLALTTYGLNQNPVKISGPPGSRSSYTAGVVNGKICVIGGGADNSNYLDTVEEYDPVTDTWTTKPIMPVAHETSIAGDFDGGIYVFGGSVQGDARNGSDTVYKYDTTNDTWTTEEQMPTQRVMVGTVGNKIYAIGGYSREVVGVETTVGESAPSGGITNDSLVAYYANNESDDGGTSNIFTSDDVRMYDRVLLKSEIQAHSQSGVDNLVGLGVTGFEDNNIVCNSYSGSWALDASLNTERCTNGVAAYSMYIYSVGRHTVDFTASVEYAKINTDGRASSWSSTSSMVNSRRYHGIVAYNDYIYAVGGYDGDNLNSVEYAEINSDGTLGQWKCTSSMKSKRAAPGVIIFNGYIYAVGGYHGDAAVTSVEYAKINPDGTIGPWTFTASRNVSSPNPNISEYNDYLYTVGGVYNRFE